MSKNKEVSFRIECEALGVYVGDCLRIKQMLFNLLENGVKFNKPGGSVFLRIDLETAGKPVFTLHCVIRVTVSMRHKKNSFLKSLEEDAALCRKPIAGQAWA